MAGTAIVDGVEQFRSIGREKIAEGILPLLAQLIALREVDNAAAIGTAAIDLRTAGRVGLEVDPLPIGAERRIVGVLAERDHLLESGAVALHGVDGSDNGRGFDAAGYVLGGIVALPGLRGEY